MPAIDIDIVSGGVHMAIMTLHYFLSLQIEPIILFHKERMLSHSAMLL
jgi:hypothetical protein